MTYESKVIGKLTIWGPRKGMQLAYDQANSLFSSCFYSFYSLLLLSSSSFFFFLLLSSSSFFFFFLLLLSSSFFFLLLSFFFFLLLSFFFFLLSSSASSSSHTLKIGLALKRNPMRSVVVVAIDVLMMWLGEALVRVDHKPECAVC